MIMSVLDKWRPQYAPKGKWEAVKNNSEKKGTVTGDMSLGPESLETFSDELANMSKLDLDSPELLEPFANDLSSMPKLDLDSPELLEPITDPLATAATKDSQAESHDEPRYIDPSLQKPITDPYLNKSDLGDDIKELIGGKPNEDLIPAT